MTPNEFIAHYGAAARQACAGTGLLASINLAQAILESGWGKSRLTMQANNFFGVKAGKSWRGPVVKLPTQEDDGTGKLTTIIDSFRKYASPAEAFADRVQLFRTLSRYKRLFQVDTFEMEARLLKECGYATDSQYPQKLIAIVKQYNLTRFDA